MTAVPDFKCVASIVDGDLRANLWFAHVVRSDAAFGPSARIKWLAQITPQDMIVVILGSHMVDGVSLEDALGWTRTVCCAVAFLPTSLDAQYPLLQTMGLPCIPATPFAIINAALFTPDASVAVTHDTLMNARPHAGKRRHLVTQVPSYLVVEQSGGDDGVVFAPGSVLTRTADGTHARLADPLAILDVTRRCATVMSSSRYEAWSRTVGEALACGKPVIWQVTRDGRTAVLHDGNSIHVAEETPAAWAAAVAEAQARLDAGTWTPAGIRDEFVSRIHAWRCVLADWIVACLRPSFAASKEAKFAALTHALTEFIVQGKFIEFLAWQVQRKAWFELK